MWQNKRRCIGQHSTSSGKENLLPTVFSYYWQYFGRPGGNTIRSPLPFVTCRKHMILYKILDGVGFGGKVLKLIQSMYFNDNVQVRLGLNLSSPLWFTREVKQGCALLPLLFALFIAALEVRLQETELGVKLRSITLSGIFFADDLMLISRTSKRGMTKLLHTVYITNS